MKRMNRRAFLGAVGFTAGAGLLGRSSASAQGQKPNIVYILADDLGYGDVKALNPNAKIPTPNIDRVAQEGIRFTDAHSGSSVCTPTRYGILTGRYAWRTSLKAGVTWGYSPLLIEEDRLTVPSFLKGHGYRTAGVGKWHLGLGWETVDGKAAQESNVDFGGKFSAGPHTVGFDQYYGIPASLDMDPYVYIEDDHVEELPTQLIGGRTDPAFYRGGPVASGFYHSEVLPRMTDKAVGYIEEHAAEHKEYPLFLYFPLTAPHVPLLPTKEFRGKSGVGLWGDFIAQLDWTIGQVMDALARTEMAENTLLIVTSDNGATPKADFEALAEKGHYPSAHFRGFKADVYEGGHRIPFFARWPGRIAADSSSDETICHTDLLATCAALLGDNLPKNAGEDSYNILPALLGTQGDTPIREATVHHSMDGLFAIRQGKWKLNLCPGSGGWSYPQPGLAKNMDLPPVQLYDLEEDAGELNNLYKERPEVVAELTALLESYKRRGRSTPG